MKKYIFFVVAMVMLASCGGKSTSLPEFEPFVFESTDNSTYEVRITYQHIANMWDSEAYSKIEWQNYMHSFPAWESVKDENDIVAMDIEAMAASIVAEYSEYAKSAEGPICSYIMDQAAFFVRDDSVLCYETLVDSFAGGAHGAQMLWCECFDIATGAPYDFRYLFDGEWGGAVKALVYERLCADNCLSIDSAEALPMSSSATLTDTGVVLVYQPYEVAAYLEGILSVEISDEELEACGAPILWQ